MAMTIRDVLITARERITDPRRWCQGALAKDAFGNRVSPVKHNAVRWCAAGACDATAGLMNAQSNAAVNALACELYDKSLVSYNDRPETTHADILALYDRAIAAQGTA